MMFDALVNFLVEEKESNSWNMSDKKRKEKKKSSTPNFILDTFVIISSEIEGDFA